MPPKKKQPGFYFYVGDWKRDTRALSPAQKGAWIDLLAEMYDSKEQGTLDLIWDEYARVIGASVAEAKKIIARLIDLGICNCEKGSEKITMSRLVTDFSENFRLISRRMHREYLVREADRLRKAKQRESRACPADVTPPLSSSLTCPKGQVKNKKSVFVGGQSEGEVESEFRAWFWPEYPKDGKMNCSKKQTLIKFKQARKKASEDLIRDGLRSACRYWASGKVGSWVPNPPHPTTWLNQERWEADYSVTEKENPYAGIGRKTA